MVAFFGCDIFSPFSTINDYQNFLDNLITYSIVKENSCPEIDGYTPLLNIGFDSGLGLFTDSDYTYVEYDGVGAILSTSGTLTAVENNLSVSTFYGNTYTFYDGDLIGLKTATTGSVIIPAKYADIVQKGTTALACKDDVYDLYINGILHKENISGNLFLVAENYLYYNASYVDLDLNLVTYNGYRFLSNPANDMAIITNDYLMGYVSSDRQIIIEPQYAVANGFSNNGYARVLHDYKWVLIDKNNNIVKESLDNYMVVDFTQNYVLYYYNNKYYVFDHLNNLVATTLFSAVTTCLDSVMIGYIGNATGIYSIIDNTYFKTTFDKVEILNDKFLCLDSAGKYVLLDSNFNEITSRNVIGYNGSVLTIESEDKFYYYKEIV